MSTLTGNQDGNVFVLGQIAQAVGDYFTQIKRRDEAKEEYQQAITAYNLVPHSSPDFAPAQNQKGIVQKILEEWQNHTAPAINVIPRQVLAQLREWFANLFQSDWQPPEVILTPAFASRSVKGEEKTQLADKIERAKIISLDTQAVTVFVQLNLKQAKMWGLVCGLNRRAMPFMCRWDCKS